MEIELDSKFIGELRKIRKGDPKLLKLISRKLSFFKENPNHSSLRLHKLSGSMAEAWSISVNRSMRMVFYYKNDDIAYFVSVGKHEQVYK